MAKNKRNISVKQLTRNKVVDVNACSISLQNIIDAASDDMDDMKSIMTQCIKEMSDTLIMNLPEGTKMELDMDGAEAILKLNIKKIIYLTQLEDEEEQEISEKDLLSEGWLKSKNYYVSIPKILLRSIPGPNDITTYYVRTVVTCAPDELGMFANIMRRTGKKRWIFDVQKEKWERNDEEFIPGIDDYEDIAVKDLRNNCCDGDCGNCDCDDCDDSDDDFEQAGVPTRQMQRVISKGGPQAKFIQDILSEGQVSDTEWKALRGKYSGLINFSDKVNGLMYFDQEYDKVWLCIEDPSHCGFSITEDKGKLQLFIDINPSRINNVLPDTYPCLDDTDDDDDEYEYEYGDDDGEDEDDDGEDECEDDFDGNEKPDGDAGNPESTYDNDDNDSSNEDDGDDCYADEEDWQKYFCFRKQVASVNCKDADKLAEFVKKYADHYTALDSLRFTIPLSMDHAIVIVVDDSKDECVKELKEAYDMIAGELNDNEKANAKEIFSKLSTGKETS